MFLVALDDARKSVVASSNEGSPTATTSKKVFRRRTLPGRSLCLCANCATHAEISQFATKSKP
jgi:hypothetical protein